MSNHGHRGVLSFRIQIPPLCSECPVPCPPPSELSSHALCVSSRSSPFAVSHHQHHRHHPHHHHHHSTCDSDFSTSICHVTLTFASKRVKQRNVGASPCFGWTEIFPSFCHSGDLLAHDVHIDKPKAWCQQKRARSHVGFRTEWSPASPVTQLPFVSPLLKFVFSIPKNHVHQIPPTTNLTGRSFPNQAREETGRWGRWGRWGGR